jgi:predicted aconitase
VRLIILTNQISKALLERGGLLERDDPLSELERFGAEILLDTCVFHSPVVSPGVKRIMTNSGKCAYYAPGELDVEVFFGNLEDCILSAVYGEVTRKEAAWRS